MGFDGRRTWSRFKNDPAHFDDPSPSNLAAFVADIDLLAFVNFEARFPGASVKGTEDLADGKAYVIAATPAGSDWVERFYFDVKTGLLVRHDAEFDEDGFRKTTTEYLDLYGPAGNVRVAFRTRAYYDNVLTFDLRMPNWPFFALAWVGDFAAVLLIAIRTYRLIREPEAMTEPKPNLAE